MRFIASAIGIALLLLSGCDPHVECRRKTDKLNSRIYLLRNEKRQLQSDISVLRSELQTIEEQSTKVAAQNKQLRSKHRWHFIQNIFVFVLLVAATSAVISMIVRYKEVLFCFSIVLFGIPLISGCASHAECEREMESLRNSIDDLAAEVQQLKQEVDELNIEIEEAKFEYETLKTETAEIELKISNQNHFVTNSKSGIFGWTIGIGLIALVAMAAIRIRAVFLSQN